jgi:hypothetical protein
MHAATGDASPKKAVWSPTIPNAEIRSASREPPVLIDARRQHSGSEVIFAAPPARVSTAVRGRCSMKARPENETWQFHIL